MFFSKDRPKAKAQDREYDLDQLARTHESRQRSSAHKSEQYAESCGAQPCTAEDYAKWLSSYIMIGGRVTAFRQSFDLDRYRLATKRPSYVPKANSAESFTLVVPRDIDASALNAHTRPRNYDGTLGDVDRGWGDNEVCAFHRGVAWTSRDRKVECAPEIIKLLDLKPQRWRSLENQLGQYEQDNYDEQRREFNEPMMWRLHFPKSSDETSNDLLAALADAEEDFAYQAARLRKLYTESADNVRQNHEAIIAMMR